MRVVAHATFSVRDADHFEELDGALKSCGGVHLQVQLKRFRQLPANGQHRVERRHRLLKDHRNLVAADVADFVLVDLEQVLAFEDHFAAYDLAWRRGDQAQNRQRAHALAAAALPYQAQSFTCFDVVRHAVHSANDAVIREEGGAQVFDLEERRHYRTGSKRERRDVPRMVGKRRLELLRLAAHEPKSCSSANSDTSPR